MIDCIAVKVICDHKSGKSKGYGFVHFVSEESATKTLAEMHGQVKKNIRIINKNIFFKCNHNIIFIFILLVCNASFQLPDGRNIQVNYANKK